MSQVLAMIAKKGVEIDHCGGAGASAGGTMPQSIDNKN
jgi:hypothetical protein